MNLHIIEVKIHKPVNDGFRVKVAVIDLGFYLNGVLVFPPNQDHKEWVVYPPSIKTQFKSIYPAEFDKKKDLWLEIHEACVTALKQHQSNQDVTDIESLEDFDRAYKNVSFGDG